MARLSREQEVLAFFVQRLGAPPGRLQLMKMLYLSDFEARRYMGKPITGMKYILFKHGPFSEDLYAHLKVLQGSEVLREEPVMLPNGKTTSRYVPGPTKAEPSFSPAEIEVLSYVARTYGGMELHDLLEEVVYKTEPMIEALSRGTKEDRLELKMEMVDGAMINELGLPLDQVLERLKRVRDGQLMSHRDAMRYLNELIAAA